MAAKAKRLSKKPHRPNARGPQAVDWAPAYLAALAETCHCGRAADAADIDNSTVWRRRKADPEFEQAYQDALQIAAAGLEAEAVRRAKDGLRRLKFNAKTGQAYLDPATQEPYIEHEYSDTLLLALLRRFFPEQYRERQQVDHTGSTKMEVTVHVLSEARREELMAKRMAAINFGKS